MNPLATTPITRNDLPAYLIAHGCGGASAQGAELGVASGTFSAHLLANLPDLSRLWSIDAWEDGDRGHDDAQLAVATQRLAPFGDRSRVVQARFEAAVHDFADGSLDFIYIDGYAHQGNAGGGTLAEWWPKLRAGGGVFAGHDYHPQWPKNITTVDEFYKAHAPEIDDFFLTSRDKFPSWVMTKGGGGREPEGSEDFKS